MKKQILVVGGLVLLVGLLAGAAYVGGRLLNGQGLPGLTSNQHTMSLGRPGGGQQSVSFEIQRAQELPQQEPDVEGVLDHRQDGSIFVGTGDVRMMVNKDRSGKLTTSSSHDGPTVEVVVTTRTAVYRDVTMKQFDGEHLPDGKIPQVLEEGSLDEIGQDSMIMAWGRETGGRLIADVLVYTPSGIMIKR